MDITGTVTGAFNAIRLTNLDNEDAGAASGWSIANAEYWRDSLTGTSWTVQPDGRSMKIGINGSVNPPPPLVSNLGQADGSFLGVVPSDRAQAFSTGPNATGYTLGRVDVEFFQLSDAAVFTSKLTATVRSDSGGSPDAVVGTLANPAYQQTLTDRVFSFAAPAGGIALAADATYWLVLDSDGTLQGNHRVRATASDGEDAGAEAGFSVADTSASRPAGDSTDNWSSVAESMKLSVRGSANPEPPPEPDSDGSHTVPHDWELVPSGLDSGDEFRLLFMTTSKRNAM